MNYLKSLWTKDIFKVSFWSGINTFIKLITGFVLGKVLAIVVGPSGVAMIGQLTNFTTIFNTLSTGAVHTGVTKYVSEYSNDDERRVKIIKTSFFIVLAGSILCSLVLLLGAETFNRMLFNGLQFKYVIYVYAFTIFFYGVNTIFLSIINGFKEFRAFIRLNAVISISGLVISLGLVYLSKLSGALLAVVLSQTVSCFITFFVVKGKAWFSVNHFISRPDIESFKKLMLFALMTSVSAFVLPTCQIYARSLIIDNISLDTAGLWDALNRVSGLLQLFVITSLTTYYMPRLSEIKNVSELKSEVYSTVKLVVPLLISVTLILYFSRSLIVLTLYTDQFLAITELFKFQLFGDVFKLTSWLFAMVTLARGNARYFLILEIGYFIYYIGLSYFLIPLYGLKGAIFAYSISYILHCIFSVALFLRYCYSTQERL